MKQQQDLRKSTQLISELKTITIAAGGASVVICDGEAEPLRLQVLESTGPAHVLPEELVKRYWRK